MLAFFVLLPLVVSAFIALLMRNSKGHMKAVKYIAFIASLITLGLIAMLYLNYNNLNLNPVQTMTWFSFAGYAFTLTTSTLPLNMLLMGIVGIITPLIIIYSMGFMNAPSEQPRYYFELCLFAAAMLLFAMSGDFLTMFIGWELLGVTSYLLIGFWYQRDGPPQSARKAITIILIGDILMLVGMLIIWNAYHTFTFSLLLQQASITNPAMGLALIFIMGAVFTKSAQFPFHEWLPDAMKGPTPVSAFLHSSTMVKAGVFLIAVLLPLFAAYHLLYLLLIFGIITSIIGVTNALTEMNIKRILAYSTIEDLGLMFIALGSGSLIATMILFVAQTFYKALLFMGAGAMITANNYEEDMEKMYNSPRYFTLFIAILIGAASLAALYPLSGFFGKAVVDLSVNNLAVYALLLLLQFFSAIYIFRWVFAPLHRRTPEKKTIGARANYKTLPKTMMLPIYILALLVAVSGMAIYSFVPTYLKQGLAVAIGTPDILLSVTVFILGFFVALGMFYFKDLAVMEGRRPAYKLLYNSILTNYFYGNLVKLSLLISSVLESIDNTLYGLIKEGATNVREFGNLIKKIETGNPNLYVAAFVVGLIIIVAVFIL